MRKRSGRPPRFAAIPNNTVDDAAALDLAALGLLTVLIRHQDGWNIQLADIARKYGYGRDGLAGSMGLLQAARYVVKIRIMSVKGNQWSTEVVVYDTPATDDEVAALLASVEREPGVRQVQLIAPTTTARASATKRQAKLAGRPRAKPSITVPRLPQSQESGLTCEDEAINQVFPESPDTRDSGKTGVIKKTVSQKTTEDSQAPAARAAGDALRATTGSSMREAAGGSATSRAAGEVNGGTRSGKASKRPKVRMSREQAAAVSAVDAAWPDALAALLPTYRPPVLLDAILAALDAGRTAEQLVARVERRWWAHGYREALSDGGPGIKSPVGVAVGLVRPSTDCPDPMCEDGTRIQLGPDDVCPKCEQRRKDRLATRRQGMMPSPGKAGPTPVWWNCEGDGCTASGHGPRPQDGRCRQCRDLAEAETIHQATADLRAARDAEYAAQAKRAKAALRWNAMLEDAYTEHAEHEAARSAQRRARQQAEAEEIQELRKKLAREHPELAAYTRQPQEPDPTPTASHCPASAP
ncbi:hypothetical protein [Streptomyces sp. NPDC089799]|uniref:hypothetical protein n=1 Tax=Streptomyces sp. NPDC089799 TaxID=3155066 RepID=UPI003449E171